MIREFSAANGEEVRLFSDKDPAEKAGKPQNLRNPQTSDGPQVMEEEASSYADEAPDPQAEVTEGLPLEVFAERRGIQETDVWRRIKAGELIGRTHRGRLYVYETPQALDLAPDPSPDLAQSEPAEPRAEPAIGPLSGGAASTGDGRDLPPPPTGGGDEAVPPGRTGAEGPSRESQDANTLAVRGPGESSETALFLDHLSLAKEENREILKMTQESLRKMTELTDSVVEMKDSVIEAKEAQIQALKEQLAASSQKISELKQEKEDLEMLARTAMERSKAGKKS